MQAQLRAERRKADVNRQHPKPLEKRENARLGHRRQIDDQQIDARAPAIGLEIGKRAEAVETGQGAAVVPPAAAIIEDAEHFDFVGRRPAQAAQKRGRRGATADDDGAALEAARTRPGGHETGDAEPRKRKAKDRRPRPAGKPEAQPRALASEQIGQRKGQRKDPTKREQRPSERRAQLLEAIDGIAAAVLDETKACHNNEPNNTRCHGHTDRLPGPGERKRKAAR